MTPDIYANKIAPDGTVVGARIKLDIYMDPNLGVVIVAPGGALFRIVVDDNGVIGTQAVTLS